MAKSKKKAAATEQIAALEFEPVDLASIGLSYPLSADQWRKISDHHVVSLRIALRSLQLTKKELMKMGDEVEEGRTLGEQVCDDLGGAGEWFRGISDLIDTAALRILSAIAARALKERREAAND